MHVPLSGSPHTCHFIAPCWLNFFLKQTCFVLLLCSIDQCLCNCQRHFVCWYVCHCDWFNLSCFEASLQIVSSMFISIIIKQDYCSNSFSWYTFSHHLNTSPDGHSGWNHNIWTCLIVELLHLFTYHVLSYSLFISGAIPDGNISIGPLDGYISVTSFTSERLLMFESVVSIILACLADFNPPHSPIDCTIPLKKRNVSAPGDHLDALHFLDLARNTGAWQPWRIRGWWLVLLCLIFHDLGTIWIYT